MQVSSVEYQDPVEERISVLEAAISEAVEADKPVAEILELRRQLSQAKMLRDNIARATGQAVNESPDADVFVDETFNRTFAEKLPGYEARKQQVEMAHLVARAFREGKHALIEAGTGTGKCVHGDTLVPLVDGSLLPIRDLYAEYELTGTLPQVWAMSPAYRIGPVQPLAAVRREPGNLVTLRTSAGRQITVTPDHRFFTFPGWTEASNLTPGMLIASPRVLDVNPPVQSEPILQDAEIDMLALLIADGTLNKRISILYAKADPVVRAHMEATAAELGCRVRVTAGYNMAIVSDTHKYNRVRRLVRGVGLLGCNSYEKHIPDAVFALPEWKLARFIGMLWTGDGSVEQRGLLSYSTMSETLARQLQHLLLRLDMVSRLRAKPVRYNGELLTAYEMTLYGQQALRFAQVCGPYVLGVKGTRLQNLVAKLNATPRNTNVDLIPSTTWALIDRKLARQIGFRDGHTKTQPMRRITSPMLETYCGIAETRDQRLEDLAVSDLWWDEVIGIAEAPADETYCLQMPEPYCNFVANDLVVHNSLAYLVPAINHALSDATRVVVSTGTIALQEQLVNKDIPFLQSVLDRPFRAVLVKGKSNYLCRLRLDKELGSQSLFADEYSAEPELRTLIDWLRSTTTGDKAELPFIPGAIWSRVCADDECPGKKCQYYGQCFVMRARALADDADLIVCNHHLYFADLKVQAATDGFAYILPDHNAVVFDEGHHVADVALAAFGDECSEHRIPVLVREARKLTNLPGRLAEEIEAANRAFFDSLIDPAEKRDRYALRHQVDDLPLRELLCQLAMTLDTAVCNAEEDEARAEKLCERAQLIEAAIEAMLYPGAYEKQDANDYVTWVEVEKRGERRTITLHGTPVDVSEELRDGLFRQKDSVILTSATMATGGNFNYQRIQLGLNGPNCLELNVGSPFDYPSQCLWYFPAGLPDPRDDRFTDAITDEIQAILEATSGRAFVLFTSYKQLNEVYDRLRYSLDFPVLKQGDKPRSQLIEDFRELGNAVLFATASFWEGVDCPGEVLSCVILARLPFSVPTEPVTQAKVKAIERRGGNSFAELSIPEACLRLKQGAGRLIRTRKDRGVLAILDPRLLTKGYGGIFLRSLPGGRRVYGLDEVRAFLAGGAR
jgi:ATP-dependent DNA helicase DinG